MPCSAMRGHVVGAVAAAEDAAVDLGVQRLDPAVHHFGKAGVGGDLADRDAGLLPGAAAYPPLAKISTPAATSPWANSVRPVLSLTLTRARSILGDDHAAIRRKIFTGRSIEPTATAAWRNAR